MPRVSFIQLVRRQIIAWLVRDSGAGHARGILRVWPLWETLAHLLWPSIPIPGSRYGLLELHFTRYQGPTLEIPGCRLQSGGQIAEIHMNNQALVTAMSGATRFNKMALLPMFRAELQAIADWVQSTNPPPPVQAIGGVTVLGRGAMRVGFTILPRKRSMRTLLDRMFLDGLLILYNPEGRCRLTAGKTGGDDAVNVWLSVTELIRRYGNIAAEGRGNPKDKHR